MNRTYFACLSGVLALLLGTVLAQSAQAQTLYWDPAGVGASSGTASGGTGTWAASSGTWYDGVSSDVNWTDTTGTATAVFGNTAGTVSVSGGVTANGLTFNTLGYYLTGGTITLAGVAPTITTNTASATIASIFGGSAGLTTAGTGMLTLTGANTYTGNTSVTSGTLSLGPATLGSYSSGTTTVASGAVLQMSVSSNVGSLVANKTYTGTGIIAKTGTGTLGNGNNNMAVSMAAGGVFDMQAGDLNFGGGHTIFGANLGSLNVASGATFHISDPALQFDALTGGGKINNAYDNSTPTLTIGVSGDQNNAAYGVAGNTATFSGTIGYSETYNTVSVGTMNLVKSGGGTQILTGSNGYTGTTTISGGTLQIGGSGYLGGGSYSAAIANSGALVFNTSSAQTLGGAISGSGSLTQAGNNTLTLSAANSFSGGTTVSAGTLALNNATAAGTAGVTLGNANTGSSNILLSLAQSITNPVTVSNQGTGTVTILSTQSGGAANNVPLTLNRATTITNTAATSYMALGGVISGNVGTLTFNGPTSGQGIALQSSGNTFTGTIVLASGNLETSPTGEGTANPVNIQGGTSNLYLGNSYNIGPTTIGALSGTGTISIINQTGSNYAQTISLGNDNGTATYNGVIANGYTTLSIIKSGSGAQTFAGVNTYTGGTTINGGTLQLGNASGLGANTGTLTMGGGTLDLHGFSPTIGSLTGTSGYVVANGAATLTVSAVGNSSYGGAIVNGSAATSLIKAGTGTLTLTGAGNTYSGGTSVNGGTLLLSGASSLPSSILTVGAAGTFSTADGTGRTTTLGGLTLNSGAKLAMDWSDMLQTSAAATTAGVVTLLPSGSFTSGQSYTLINALSGLTGSNYVFSNNTNYTVALNVTGSSVNVTPATGTALTTAYWYGAQVPGALGAMALSNGTASNWSTSSTGYVSTGGVVPGAAADVTFSATGATQQGSVVLGSSMTLDSVTFSDTNTVTIGADGNTLTLMGTGAASAITANQNATISAPLALGSSQTWTTASGAKLTVGGIVSGNYALTTAGSGTVVLTAANTYGGSTNISGGTLSIGNGTTNGTISSGSYNIGSNGTLLFSANSGGMTTPVWTNIFGSGTLALQTAKNFDTGSWGTIALPAAFTGTLQINSGRVPPASTAGLGGTTAIVVQAGGQLALYNLAAGSVLTQPFTIAGTGYGETNYESAIRFQPASSSSTTLTGNITLSANATVGNSGAGSGVISGIISGGTAANFTIGTSGETGIVQLTNANTFGGNTTVSYGTLKLSNSAALQNSTLTTAGISFDPNVTGHAFTFGGLSGAGAISLSDGSNTVAVSVGNNNASTTYSGVLSSSGSLVKIGSGTLTLSGDSTYTGVTTISGGKLVLNDGNTVDRGGSTIAPGANSTISVGSGATLNLGNVAQLGYTNDATRMVTVNAGTLSTANNTWNYIPNLTLQNGAAVALGSGGYTTGNGQIFDLTSLTSSGAGNTTNTISSAGGYITPRGPMTINVARGQAASDLTIGAVIANGNAGTTSVNMTGSGILLLTGANTYTGGTTINAGTLQIGGAGSLGSGTYSQAIANSGALVFSTSASQTLSGIISGSGSLTQAGPGVLSLAASNTYTGPTNVTGGTLLMNGAYSLSSSTLNVAGPGAFSTADGTARTTTVGGLNLASGAKLAMDWGDLLQTSAAASTAGNVIVAPSGSFTSGQSYTFLNAASGLNAATYNLLVNSTNYTATMSVSGGSVTVTPLTSSGTLSTAYWYGGQVPGALGSMGLSNGTLSNWSTTSGSYTATGLVPVTGANVVFSTTAGATQEANVALGAPMSLNSVTFSDTTPVAINADGNTLTLTGTGTGTSSAIYATQSAAINAAVALGSSQTWTVASGQTLSVGGPVSGAYSLSTVGPGSVALSGSDTYTGPTTISGGTLAITGSGSLGSGSYSQTITANGALVLNTSSSETFGGIISGSGSLSQLGNSVTTLNAINTYTGGTTVSGGTLALGTGGAAGIIRNALTINPGATVTASAVNWSLGYTSGTCVNSITINGGLLNFTGATQGGTSAGTLNMTGGTISGTQYDWYYSVTGNPVLNTYASNATSLISSGIQLRLNAATNNVTMNVAQGTTPSGIDLLISAPIVQSQGGGIIKTGSGTMALSAANTYNGATAIQNGTVDLTTVNNVLPTGTTVTLGAAATSGNLVLGSTANAMSQTVAGLATTGLGGSVVAGGNAAMSTLTVNLSASTSTYAGLIGGTGTNQNNIFLQETGTGVLNLSGTDTYTGGTSIAGGALIFNTLSALPTSGTLSIASGGGAALGATGAYPTVTAWLNSGVVSTATSGAIALTASSNETINLATAGSGAYTGIYLGSVGTNTYTGTLTPTVSTYYLGDTLGNLVMPGTSLTDGSSPNSVVVNGNVTLTGSNTYSGGTTLLGGTLSFANGYNLGSGTIAFNGGTLYYLSGNTNSLGGRVVNIGANGGTINPGSNSLVTLPATLTGTGQLNTSGNLAYSGTSTAFTGIINPTSGTFGVAAGGSLTNVGTLQQPTGSNVTWNVTGTLGASSVNVATTGQPWGTTVGVLNINTGGSMTATTLDLGAATNFVGGANGTVNVASGGTLNATNLNMGYLNGGYQGATATININGIVNVNNLKGVGGGNGNSSASRTVNVNAGGQLSTTTFDFSQSEGGGNSRHLNLNGGTLANIAGTNLTVDNLTVVTLSSVNTLAVSATNSATIGGTFTGSGGLYLTGGGTVNLTNASSTYTGALAFTNSDTLNISSTASQTFTSLAGVAGSRLNLGGGTLTLGSDNTNTTFAGNLAIATGGALVKNGLGIFSLSNSNTYSGTTTLNGGTLNLNFAAPGAPAANILPSGTPIVFAGGVLTITGGTGAAEGQALGGLTFSGVTTFNLTPNGATTLSMTAGNTWTRNTGSAVNFALGGQTLTSSPTLNAAGIIVGTGTSAFATFGGTDWATVTGGSIAAYSGYSGDVYTGAGTNTDITQLNPTPAAITSDTLAFRTAQANTLTLPGAVTLNAGGVLVGSQVGANATAISGGTLTSATNELLIHQFNTGGALTVNSVLANNGANPTSLTKAGPGLLVLTGANTYTGVTTVGGGTLQGTIATIPTAVALQNSANVTFVQAASAGTLTNAISGAGSFTKAGAGLLTLSSSMTYSGATVISGGTLQLGKAASLPSDVAGNLTVLLDASNAASLGSPVNGGNVTTWTNLATVGSVGNFSGGTATYVASGGTAFNNLPVVTTSGASVLSNATNFGNNVTVMYVGAMAGTQNYRLVGGYNNNWLLGYWGGAQDKAFFNNWVTSSANTPTATTATKLYEGTITSGGAGNFYSSGSLLASGASGFSGPNGLDLGGYSTGTGSEDSKGSIGQLLVYNTVLSTADRQTVEAYLQNKWMGTNLTGAQLPGTSAVNITTSGAVLDLNSAGQTIGSLTGVAGSLVTMESGILTTGNDNTNTTFSGNISGVGGSLVKIGTGAFTLAASNSYTAGTTVTGGTLIAQLNNSLGTGNLVMNNATAYTTAAVDFTSAAPTVSSIASSGAGLNTIVLGNLSNASSTSLTVGSDNTSTTFAGSIVDAGASPANGQLVKTGSGTLTLSGTNTYTGGTSVLAGALAATQAGALSNYGTAGAVSVSSGALLSLNAGGTGEFTASGLASLLSANGGNFAAGSMLNIIPTNAPAPGFTYASNITGALGLYQLGTTSGTLTLAGSNSYTGGTTLAEGYLALSGTGGATPIPGNMTIVNTSVMNNLVFATQNNQFAPGAVMTFNGTSGNGYFELAGSTQTLAGINETNSRGVIENQQFAPLGSTGSGLLVLNGSGNYSYNGYLRNQNGTLSLLMSATGGTQTLIGGNINYTGGTTVNAGQVILNDTTGFNSPTTIASGGKVSWAGAGNYSDGNTFATTLQSGGTLENINTSGYWVLSSPITASGATFINESEPAASSGNQAFYLDGGLKGSGTVTITVANAGNGVNLRNNSTSFAGTLIVNGISSATAYANSGLGVGGCTTGLTNADIVLNGSIETAAGGYGESDTNNTTFQMGALSGTGTVVSNGGSTTITLGNTGNSATFSGSIANGTGTMTLVKTGSGVQTLSGTNTYTGSTTVSGGTLALASGGVINSASQLLVTSAGTATFNLSGGTFTTSRGASGNTVYLGSSAGQTGIINMSGGLFSVPSDTTNYAMTLGDGGTGGTGIWNQTGGSANFAGDVWGANQAGTVAQWNLSGGTMTTGGYLLTQRGTGTLTISNTATVSTGYVAMVGWTLAAANGTVNLNGGTLTTGYVAENSPGQGASGTGTFNFNGGLLQAGTNSTTFMTGLSAANVLSGGAIINTNGYAITIGQALLHSGTTDGGLLKLGAGTLTLTGSNTYTGGTSVAGGTLFVSGASALPTGGVLSVAAATFSTADGTARTSTVGGLNLSSGAKLVMDWGDELQTAAIATASGSVTLVPSGALTAGTYIFLQAAGGLDGASYNLNLPLTNNTSYTPTLSVASTSVGVTFAAATPLSAAYWYGGQVPGAPAAMALSNGALSNWSSSATYTATGLVPGSAANVIFSSGGATQESSVVLGANMTLNSLTFSDTNTVTIGADGNTLTLMGTGTGTSSAISVNQNAAINANVVLGAAQTWTVANGATLSVGGVISGSNALTEAGSGLLSVSAVNTYSGSTTISGGTLAVAGAVGVLGGGSYAGTIADNGTLLFSSSAAQTLNGVISGSGGLTKTGNGYLYLGANNTFTGPTTIQAGVVQQTTGTTFSSSTAMTISNATLQVRYGSYNINQLNVGSLALAGGATLEAAPQYQADNGDIGFQNNIAVSGTNTVWATGGSYGKNNWLEGGLTGGTSAYMYLSNGSQYGNVYASGHAIILSGGTWTNYLGTINAVNDVSINGAINLSNATVIDGGSFGFYGNNCVAQFGSLSGAGALNANGMTGGVWQVGNLGTSTTYSGVMSGSASLAKVGTGMLTLSGSSTYTGGTTISAGTLAVNGALAAGSSVNIGTAGTLAGSGTISGNATLTGNGAVNLASGGQIGGTLGVTGGNWNGVGSVGGLITASAGTFTIGSGASLTARSGLNVAGGATLTGIGSIGGAVNVSGGTSAATQGTINLANGSIGVLTLSNAATALTLGTGSSPAVLDFDIGTSLGAVDQIAIPNGSLNVNAGLINITALGGAISSGTYNLITSTAATGLNTFTLGTTALDGSTLSLQFSGGTEQLVVAPAIPPTAYWQATGLAAWSTTGNWTSDQPGTVPVSQLPGASSNVYFATTGGTATVDQNFPVASLNFSSSNNVTLAGTGLLTLVGSGAVALSDTGSGSYAINAPVALLSAQTWNVSGASPLAVGGAISTSSSASGSTPLTISGTGTLVLTASNTYSGGTSIGGATLQLGDGHTANGSVTGNIVDNGILTFANFAAQSYTGSISGGGAINVSGSAPLTLTGNSGSFAGTTTISAGTLQLGDGLTANGALGGTIVDNALLNFANPTSQTFGTPITGTGGLTILGPGAVTLSVSNSYSGGTTINSGTLVLGNNNALGSGGVLLSGGSLAGAGQFAAINAQTGAISANLSGSGGLAKTTAGVVLLSGNNTYNGGTTISGGTLQLGSNGALPAAGALTLTAGTLDLAGNNPTVAAVTGSGVISNSTGAAAITVNATAASPATVNALIADGAGTTGLVKSGNGSLVLANAANNYSGGTTVAGGVLALGNATALGSASGPLTVNAGTLDLAGNHPTVGALSGASGVVSTSVTGTATLTAGNGNGSSTFNGMIVDGVGVVALVKTGSGTLALTGANNYSGGTTISGGGALAITNSGNVGSGPVTIAAATLSTGAVALDNAIQLTDVASTLEVPGSADTLTLNGLVSGSGNLNKTGAGALALADASGNTYTGDTNVAAGTLLATADNALSPNSNLVIADGASVILDFGGGVGNNSIVAFTGGAPQFAAPSLAAPALAPAGISTVPEPGTLVLLLVGALAALLVGRRRGR